MFCERDESVVRISLVISIESIVPLPPNTFPLEVKVLWLNIVDTEDSPGLSTAVHNKFFSVGSSYYRAAVIRSGEQL